jgi:hypothetical protein
MPELAHRRFRAPQEDGAALIDPPLSHAAALIERNRAIGAEFDRRAGFPSGFRAAARSNVLSALAKAEGKDLAAEDATRPIVLSGHQPELFHAGVWLKNFAISSIARASDGIAINLVIDNDTIRSAGIRVPTSTPLGPQSIEVPFDAPSGAIPWEERRVLDEQMFRNFATSVRRVFHPPHSAEWKGGMILDRFWPYAIESLEHQRQRGRELQLEVAARALPGWPLPFPPFEIANLRNCLAEARRRVENELGLSVHDFPLGWFGYHDGFLRFAAECFARHRDFHAMHNAALAEYRQVNHVRSRSHPFPDLARNGEWFELPFWLWTGRDPRRRQLFVRSHGESWELTDREGIVFRPSTEWSKPGEPARQLLARGIKLRPRALITTMYARLVLSDLFIHGIGGAKYDELTDLVIRRFFGIEPPAYITATATFRLPIERPNVTLADVRDAAQRIRELRYRPEAFVRDSLITQDDHLSQQLVALAAEKREFLDRHDLRRCAQGVFEHLDRLNRAMHDLLHPVEEETRAQQAELIAHAKQSQLLGSREFSFVLFPSEILPARLLDLCKVLS